MSISLAAFALASALYTGFQWTIRTVVYPQFAEVGDGDFVAYELAHQHRVSIAVGPLFAALGLSTLAILVHPAGRAPVWAAVLAVVLFGVVLGVTAFAAVPLHRRLSAGFDAKTHARLLRVDSIRLAAAVADTVLAGFLLLR